MCMCHLPPLHAAEGAAVMCCHPAELHGVLPTPPATLLLTGSFASTVADRDMDVLRQEVAAVLAQHLAPGSWELQERIDSQASFRDGKRLLALYLT